MSKADKTAASVLALVALALVVAFASIMDPPPSTQDDCIRRGHEAHTKKGQVASDDYLRAQCKAGKAYW